MRKMNDIIKQDEIDNWVEKMSNLVPFRELESNKKTPQEIKKDRINNAGIPLDLRNTFDAGKWSHSINELFDNYPFQNPNSIWLQGPSDSGKTRFCVEIMLKLALNYEIKYMRDSLISVILNDPNNPERQTWFEYLMNIPILLWDDFGHSRYQNVVGLGMFEEILKERTENSFKITFFTVNTSEKNNPVVDKDYFMNRVKKCCKKYFITKFENEGRSLRSE